MAMFRARVSFAGLLGFEVKRLDRVVLELGASPGETISSPGGDSPTQRTYLFPHVEVASVNEFKTWLQEQLQQWIPTPVEFTAEKIDLSPAE
jgi:hypothetical protein